MLQSTICLCQVPRIQHAKESVDALVVVPPSERFVWAMLVLLVALAGLVAIELAIILVTGAVNDVILIVVSGLVGALASRFLEAKR